jgi:hypothetical protein
MPARGHGGEWAPASGPDATTTQDRPVPDRTVAAASKSSRETACNAGGAING